MVVPLRNNARVGLLARLGRKPKDRALASKAKPPEPRLARGRYLRWVRSFFELWRHAVADVLNLRIDARKVGPRNPLLQAKWTELTSASGLNKMLDRVTSDVNRSVSKYFSGITKTQIPVDISQQVADFRKANVELISNLGADQVADLTDVLNGANLQGMRHEELAQLIEDRIGVAESRAKLIARDQTLKFNASIHQAQAEAAGIDSYIWSTSHDGAVRPMHRELDGKRFRYDDPPVTNEDGDRNNPGEDYQCRCQAIPVIPLFDGIDGAADNEEGAE